MKAKTALLVIDMQNGILKAAHNSHKLLENINGLIDHFHKSNAPVIFIRQTGKLRFRENTDTWQLAGKLQISPEDTVINKTRGNAFYKTPLLNILEKENINQVVVAGLLSNGCVQLTCKGALQNQLTVVLIKDAHSGTAANKNEIWNEKLRKLGVTLVATKEYLSFF